MGKTFSRFQEFSAIILLKILHIPFGFHFFFNSNNSQIWSFDGFAELLHILFTALE
jgi:hypothetical protein